MENNAYKIFNDKTKGIGNLPKMVLEAKTKDGKEIPVTTKIFGMENNTYTFRMKNRSLKDQIGGIIVVESSENSARIDEETGNIIINFVDNGKAIVSIIINETEHIADLSSQEPGIYVLNSDGTYSKGSTITISYDDGSTENIELSN